MPDAINPLSPRQKFLPADSVRLWVDTYLTDKWNRIPNPDGAQGAWGWTVEEPNRAVISNTTGSVTYEELAARPLVARTSVPSEVTEYEILSSTQVRVVFSRGPAIMNMPVGYNRGTDPSRYFVDLFRAPATLFSHPDSVGGGQGTYAVVQTPSGTGGESWILESTHGPLPGAPAGPVATPAAMYALTSGAYLSVDFAQVTAAETDYRVTVRTERFSVIPGANLRSYGEIWDSIYRYDTGATIPGCTKQTWFNFYRADGSYLSQLVQAASSMDGQGATQSISYLVTAPADAVAATMNIRFVAPIDGGGLNLRATFGNMAVLAGSDFVLPPEAPTVVDIFESATLLETRRGDLDAGTATLTTSDPALDVLEGTVTIPRGARAVLVAYLNNLVDPANANILGTFTVMDSRTTYPMRGRKPTPLTVIDLQDAMHKLAAAPRPDGYYEITRLPEVLEGAGVPWDVGNRSHSYGTEPADTHSESATALDQIALTRDAHPGTYAYVDRFGVINVHQDTGTLDDRTREFYFDETDFNADAVPSVSSQDVINTVMITVQGAIPETDSESVYNSATFGPYVDQASVDEFGARKAEIEITVPYDDAIAGLVTTEYLRPVADAILSRNAQPYLKFEELTFGVSGDHENGRNITITEASIDVADLAYLTSPSAGMVDAPYRVRSVAHVITPRTWVMTLGFAGESTLATPATQPPMRSTAVKPQEWIEWTKISPSAAAANVKMEYRIVAGRFIEFRFDGALAADVAIPASGDNANVNITSSFPGNMRPEVGNWGWPFSVGRTAFMYVTPGGTVTWANSAGAAGTVTAGTSMSHQSPLFALPAT